MRTQELVDLLTRKKGARIVTIVTRTTPDVKSGSPVMDKVSIVNGTVNCKEYGNRAWGERMGSSSVVTHKGVTYLEVVVNNRTDSYYDREGNLIPLEEAQARLRRPPRFHEGYEVRDYSLDSIKAFSVDGVPVPLEK